MEEDRFVLRSITAVIMYELMLLAEQEYVDVYAATMKERLLAAAKRTRHPAPDAAAAPDAATSGPGGRHVPEAEVGTPVDDGPGAGVAHDDVLDMSGQQDATMSDMDTRGADVPSGREHRDGRDAAAG